jgi:hypothetical protein
MKQKYEHGGYVSDTGLMGTTHFVVGHDEETGNEIPFGSTAENVADTIDAKLSEGEFVIPADVVRWYGVQHFISMIEEAKMQFMLLAVDQEAEEVEVEDDDMDVEVEEDEEEEDEEKEGSFSIKTTPKIAFIS